MGSTSWPHDEAYLWLNEPGAHDCPVGSDGCDGARVAAGAEGVGGRNPRIAAWDSWCQEGFAQKDKSLPSNRKKYRRFGLLA